MYNFQAKQGGAKPKQRKNWRKSATIQLVPTEPPPPASASAPDNAEAAPQNRADIPLRLPRAMSAAENNPLTDRNATKAGESVSSNKENGSVATTRAPAPAAARSRKNAAMEKENHLG